MRRRLLLLLLAINFILFNTIAQTTTAFRINYDQALMDLPGNIVEGITPNTYVMAGSNVNFIPIYGTVSQIDNTGAVVWSYRYSDASIGFQLNDIKKDQAANNYYVCGGSSSNAAVFMILDANGAVVNSKKFHILEADGAWFNRVTKTSDGGYIAVGYVTGYDPDGAGPEIKFATKTWISPNDGSTQTERIGSPLIVKLDANGDHLWHKVFRYYTAAAKNATEAIDNSAEFSDVVEVADGYVAVGKYKVNQFRSKTSGDDDDDATPTDAIILKLDKSATIVYHQQIDTPSTLTSQSSKYLASVNKTSAGDIITAGATDGGYELIQKFTGVGGFSNIFSRRFRYSNSFIFGTDPVDNSQIYEVAGSTDLVTMGMYVKMGIPPVFTNAIHRMDPTATSNVWTKRYDFGLAAILPRGGLVSDGGYISFSTTMGMGSFDYHVIKTDPTGDTPLLTCPPTTVTPTGSAGPNTFAVPYYNVWQSTPRTPNTLSIVRTAITLTKSEQCIKIACTPPPVASTVTATPSTICSGQSTTITASGAGSGVSYNVYTSASGGTSIGTTPLVVSPTSPTTYYIETVDNTDPLCVSTSRASVTVTVNPIPTVTASATSTSICSGQTLSLNSSGGTSYSWSGPNGFSSTLQNPTIPNTTTAASGTYIVTVSDGTCSAQANVVVTVNLSPTATASATDATICSGQTLSLNSSGGTSYSWSGPDGFSSTLQNPTIPNTTTAASGTYIVTVSNGTCSAQANVVVTVNLSPTAAASATDATICEGQTLNLNGSGGGTYSWSGPNGFSSTLQNPTISNATTADAGTYTLTVSNGTCSAQANVVITVNIVPTATASAINTSICSGETISLSSSGGGTYSWIGPDGFSSTLQNPTIPNTTTAASGTYIVTVSNGTCSAQADVTVTVKPLPNPGASSNSAICEGQTLNLNGSGGGTYSWSGPNGYSSTLQTPTIPNATTAASGTYSLTVTGSNDCSAIATVEVTINPKPTVNASSNSPVCVGQTINLTSSAGGSSYSWTGPNGFSSIQQNPSITNATSTAAGTYFVTMTNSNNCSNQNSVTVVVNDNPTASASSNSPVCQGGTLTLSSSGGTSYSWSGPNGFTSSQQNPSINNVPLTAVGSYTVTVTNGAGCTSQAFVDVLVNAIPIINASASPTVICSGTSTTISVTGPSGTSYSWDNGVGTNPSNVVSPTITTTYIVTAIGTNNCQNTAQVTITVNPSPSYTSTTTNPTCGANNGQINLTANGGTPSYSYSINNGSTVQGNGNFTGLSAGGYNILITDDNNCTATGTINLSNVGSPTINSITPSDPSCNGLCDGGISVSASGGTGTLTYQWYDQDSNPIGINSNSITGLCSGSYSIVVSDQNSCVSSTSASLTNPPIVNASFTLTDFCQGAANNASNIATPNGVFSFNPAVTDGATINPSTGEITNGVGGTTYNVQYLTTGACPNSSIQTVTVSTPANAGTISGPTTLCPSGTAIYNSTEAGGTWSSGNPLVATINSSGDLTAIGTGSLIISYSVVGTGGCPNAVATYTITIDDNSAPVFNGGCLDDTTLFSSLITSCDVVIPDFTSSTLLDITDDCGNIASGSITVTQTPSAGTVLSSGIYTVMITATDNSNNSSTCSFQVIIADTLSPVFNGGCINDTTFYSSASSCAITVPDFTSSSQLNITDNCSSIASGTLTVTQYPTAGTEFSNGTHTVWIYATDNNNNVDSCSFSLTVSDTISPTISIIPASNSFCEGENVIWQEVITDNCGIASTTSSHHSGDVLPIGVTTVSYTATDVNGNTSTYFFDVMVGELPIISSKTADTVNVCAGLPITLTVDNPNPTYSYTWYFGGNEVGTGDKYTISSTQTNNEGIYTVEVSNANGCTIEKDILLIVEVCDFLIPEVFSPNMDGSNDYFYISNLESYPNTKIWIYNRWGVEVYQSDNYLNDWDGTSQSKLNVAGDELPEGTYYYIFQLGGTEGQFNSGEIYKGFIYLKR